MRTRTLFLAPSVALALGCQPGGPEPKPAAGSAGQPPGVPLPRPAALPTAPAFPTEGRPGPAAPAGSPPRAKGGKGDWDESEEAASRAFEAASRERYADRLDPMWLKMTDSLRERVPPGAPAAQARKVLEGEGFKCVLEEGSGGRAMLTGSRYDSHGWIGGTHWTVRVKLKDGRVRALHCSPIHATM